MSKLIFSLLKVAWAIFPKLRELLAADNAQLNTELQEKLSAYEQHFAQTAKEVEALKAQAVDAEESNLRLRVQNTMHLATIESLQKQAEKLRNEIEEKKAAVDRLPPRVIWDVPIVSERGSAVAKD